MLVAGGEDAGHNPIFTAEIYDPATGLWTETANLTASREEHTANLLPNGSVLAVGGIGVPFSTLASAEYFGVGLWHAISRGLHTARTEHTATTLLDGSVLVAGGIDANDKVLKTAERFSRSQ